jgi:ATP-dependent RNA helicase RhlE
VLAPTRELAVQIAAELRTLAGFTKLTATTIHGGVSPRSQIDALARRPDVVVACPGRLLDLLRQRHARLGGIEVLVLDEADHMFDIGFLPDVRRILAALPARRQNLLFSATMPAEVRHLADELLREPHVVELDHRGPAATIEHALYPVPEQRKRDLLEHLLAENGFASAIVFTRTKHRARRLAEQLGRSGHRAVALQGNMSQSQRDRAMQGFRAGRFDVLVATDLAARGIDVANVSHVINFDVPNTPHAYTHRIGRTGRAERDGKAFTFVTEDDRAMVRSIERTIGAPIARCRVEGFEGVSLAPVEPERSRPSVRSRWSGATASSRSGAGSSRRARSRRGRRPRGPVAPSRLA